MSEKEKYVKLKSLDDLVKIVAPSHAAFLQHVEHNERHIYFINVMFHDGGSLIYYVKMDEKINAKYVVFNMISGNIGFSDTISTDTNLRFIPIIEVEKQNILTEEILTS